MHTSFTYETEFVTWNNHAKQWWGRLPFNNIAHFITEIKELSCDGRSFMRKDVTISTLVLIHDVQVRCLASASSCFIHQHLGKTLHSHCSQEALRSATKDTVLPVWAWFLVLFILGTKRGCLFYVVCFVSESGPFYIVLTGWELLELYLLLTVGVFLSGPQFHSFR